MKIIKMISVKLLQIFSSLIYKLLPATTCSKIAMSRPAKLIVNLISKKGISTYSLKYGIKLNLTREEAMSGYLQLGQLNPIESKTVQQFLKQGDVFFDIGAYVDGWYSILASNIVKETGHVFSFEPIPYSFSRLNDNVKLNDCQNITTEKLALSDKNGKQKFVIDGHFSGYRESTQDKDKSTTVETKTIDSYVKEKKLNRVDFIKIDVEGLEKKVLEGAIKTLTSYKPLLLVEVVDKNLSSLGLSARELISYICDLGYKAHVIRTHGLKPYDSKHTSSTTPNMFFTPIKK